MSRKFCFLIIAAASLMILSSCRKDGHGRNENKSVTLNVTVNAGEVYKLDLSQYGDADDLATITRQATSYATTSEINRNITGNNIYSFSKSGSPKTGGNGTDLVILKVYEPEGRCRNHDETNITINFTIL
ncbi:MAG: hypothetical protein IPP72_14065 [Chitinophagaceae bacterium]|nr:hypothetical protein [Chitinophagaceae bacterium]